MNTTCKAIAIGKAFWQKYPWCPMGHPLPILTHFMSRYYPLHYSGGSLFASSTRPGFWIRQCNGKIVVICLVCIKCRLKTIKCFSVMSRILKTAQRLWSFVFPAPDGVALEPIRGLTTDCYSQVLRLGRWGKAPRYRDVV